MLRTAAPALLFLVTALVLSPALGSAPGFAPALASALGPAPLAAQEPGVERAIEASGLPRAMIDRLIRMVTDPATHRIDGDAQIPADSLLPGNLVVTGELQLAGRVRGDVLVLGGDAALEEGFEIGGDLTVIDGEIRGEERGRIGGVAAALERGPVRAVPTEGGAEGRVALPIARDDPSGASAQFELRGEGYNRVEGIPFLVGPSLTTGGEAPFRLEALLIWRTEHERDFGFDRQGWQVEAEQFLGGGRSLRLGAGVHSRVDPIEGRGMSDRENAWSTLLLRNDRRDHLEREGWKAFVRITPARLPLDARVEYREEEHRSVPAGDPWSIFGSDRDWRLQPLVAEGRHRALTTTFSLDTREGRRDPDSGWLVEGSWRRGLGGALALPPVATDVGVPDAEGSSVTLDLRRYLRVGPGARLNLRLFGGGALGDAPLAPQHQVALGGIGTLPAHPEFAVSCGSRDQAAFVERGGVERAFLTGYGCDRWGLLQAELRGGMRVRTGFGAPPEAIERSAVLRAEPRWSVFFNGGRGWVVGDRPGSGRMDSPARYDAGVGLQLGGLGVYWAVPVADDAGDGSSRFFVRLDRRF